MYVYGCVEILTDDFLDRQKNLINSGAPYGISANQQSGT